MQNNPSSTDKSGNNQPAREQEQEQDASALSASSAAPAADSTADSGETTIVASDQGQGVSVVQESPISPRSPEKQPVPEEKGSSQVGTAPVTPRSSPSPSIPVPATPTPRPPQSPRYFPPSEYIPVSEYNIQRVSAPSSPSIPPAPPRQTLPEDVTLPPWAPRPGYIPPQPVLPPGAIPQPGYVPPQRTVPPGAIPQPGYVPPQRTVPPGAILQPGYVPSRPAVQPGYVPAPGMQPPVLRSPRNRRQLGVLVIGGAAMSVVIILGIVLAVSLNRRGSASTAGTATAPPISASPTTSTGRPTSAFQPAACPFEADPALLQAPNPQLSCGYVTVPQERGVKNGLTVKLAVAIFKAPEYMNSVDPAPVIRLDGGPGGPSLADWAQYITKNNARRFIFHHDVVMFDQRGTGYSTPSLNCPELNGNITSNSAYEQAARTCYNRLVAQGIDLNGFNSPQNAGDVADIIHALGYKQMTLYGVSYGTRLALTTMRLYPAVVRAAVLDSVYPPSDNRNQLPSSAQRAFDVLFQGCAKNPACNQKYPDLQHVFYTLVDQLNAKPISFQTVDATTNHQYTITFAGDDLVSWVFSVLYVTQLIPVIPQVIYQIKNHTYTQLASIYGLIMFDDTLSAGFFYSAECSEDWPFLTQQSITQSEQGIEPHIARVFAREGEQQEYDICQFWKVRPVPAAQKQPVVSSIPTLITTGEYDPITPPANGQEAAKTLSRSYFFQFPGQGHGQEYSSACSDLIISSFEDNPQVKPDGSCISQMNEPQFV